MACIHCYGAKCATYSTTQPNHTQNKVNTSNNISKQLHVINARKKNVAHQIDRNSSTIILYTVKCDYRTALYQLITSDRFVNIQNLWNSGRCKTHKEAQGLFKNLLLCILIKTSELVNQCKVHLFKPNNSKLAENQVAFYIPKSRKIGTSL